MGIKNLVHKTKKGVSEAAKGAVNGLKTGLSEAQKELGCLEAIKRVESDVQGLDPRTWCSACAKSTLFAMKGPEAFKKCLEDKVKKEIKVIEDPEAYVETLWEELEDNCGCFST